MPGPFKKRKRQPRARVSNRKTEDPTAVASEAAEADEAESSHDDPTRARSTREGVSPGEYRPL